jgi:hypothetical protein
MMTKLIDSIAISISCQAPPLMVPQPAGSQDGKTGLALQRYQDKIEKKNLTQHNFKFVAYHHGNFQ